MIWQRMRRVRGSLEGGRDFGSALLLLLVLAGCNSNSEPPGPVPSPSPGAATEEPSSNSATGDDSVATPEGPSAPTAAVETRWEVCFIGSAKVGHSYTQSHRIRVDGQPRIRIRTEQHLKLVRDGDATNQHLVLESVEQPDGTLERFSSRMSGGSGQIETEGRRQGDELHVALKTQGAEKTQQMPWNRKWGGFFAVEQSLARQPLQPGETRSLRMLVPLLNLVAEARMTAGNYQATEMRVGSKELLRVDCRIQLPGTGLDLVYWMDRDGSIHKSWDPQVDLYCYRTTKEATLVEYEGSFDLNVALRVPVQKSLAEPHQTRRIRYRVKLERGNPAEIFPSGQSQQVKAAGAHEAEIVVTALRPDRPEQVEAAADAPAAGDRESNALIQSDDPRIQQMANSVAPGEDDPWAIAVALEKYVRQSIRIKDFSQSFATAAEVAQSLQGDCTEHAVLLAALCRARGIPARVASGLVYYRQGFAYHMWNEVWIDDRWIPMDATLGQAGIGAAHLKLAESDLEGVSPLGTLLPVVQVLGQLTVEIEEIE